MKRYIITTSITLAALLLLTVANVARGQSVIYGNRTYTAPVCNRPNCAMCNAIRAGLAAQRTTTPETSYSYGWSYQWQRVCNNGVCSWQQVRVQSSPTVTTSTITTSKPAPVATVKAEQAPSKDEQIDAMLSMLSLTPSDAFADIGCGDGRICIAAVEQYGCRAVGIEIDPTKAAEARRNVLKAVSEHRIPDGSVQIITGDGLQRTPTDVSAAVVYLFPETLEELRPVLRRIPRVVSSQHPIPGMVATVERDGLYLYRNERPAPVVARPAVPERVYTGGIQIVN